MTTALQNQNQPEKYKRVKKLDALDNILLYLIAYGADSLSYLSIVLDHPKQTISDRVKRLELVELVESIENKSRYNYRKYVITDKGESLVTSLNLLSNLLLLKSGKLSDTE